jgi:transposase
MIQLGHAHRLATAAAGKERLLLLASFLPESQRALLDALLGEGVPARVIAKLRGTSPRTVRRRASLLVERVNSPAFAIVVSHGRAWPPLREAIARLCVVDGVGMRAAAARLGVSLYTVRREVAQVRAIAEAMALAGRVPDLTVSVSGRGEARRTA